MIISPMSCEELQVLEPVAREFYTSSQFLREFDMGKFIALWTRFIEAGQGVIYSATEHGQILGVIGGMYYPEPYSGDRIAQEFFWFVHQKHRGSAGLKLYRAFEHWARDNGCAEIRMGHLSDSMPEKLAHVYHRLGFSQVETNYAKRLIETVATAMLAFILAFLWRMILPADPQYSEAFIGTALALTMGALAAGGALGSSAIASHAAGSAAGKQQTADQAAIAEQQRQFDINQQNAAPFVSAGQTSIGQLMKAIQSGQFGPGSMPQLPADFKVPTLEEARATPGYAFTQEQGNKGILQGAAAAGGAVSGGTLKALDSFNTGLADSTYNDVFSRALSTYQAGLAGFGSKLAGQQQEFNQLLAPAEVGSGQVSSIGQLGQQSATNIGQLMQAQGNAGAAGTVGSANALTSGISGSTSGLLQSILLGKLFGAPGSNPPPATPAGPGGESIYGVG